MQTVDIRAEVEAIPAEQRVSIINPNNAISPYPFDSPRHYHETDICAHRIVRCWRDRMAQSVSGEPAQQPAEAVTQGVAQHAEGASPAIPPVSTKLCNSHSLPMLRTTSEIFVHAPNFSGIASRNKLGALIVPRTSFN